MNTDIDMKNVIDNTLVLVLAGGQGSRLKALTQMRAKPVLEFGGYCRIIDFPLSNCINSGLNKIAVLTQYKSQCLIRHLMQQWGPINTSFGGRLDILPASQQQSENWYQGTADACYQNIEYIKAMAPKYIVILSGDHVYQMDYRDMLRTHIRNGADMTVSCIEVPTKNAAHQLGVLSTNAQGKISAFDEKPAKPHALLDAPDYCLASMGNYVVNADVLLNLLKADAREPESDHDFGKNVIPSIIEHHRIFAHRFRGADGNQIPYWRDVGTLDSYWRAHMDLLNNTDMLNLSDPAWPIWGHASASGPTEITNHAGQPASKIEQTIIGSGSRLVSCQIQQSVLSAGCVVEEGVALNRCVLLPGATIGAGASLDNAIVDKGVAIPPKFVIWDTDIAREQGFTVSEKGVVLVTQAVIDKLKYEERTVANHRRLGRLSSAEHSPHRFAVRQPSPGNNRVTI